MLAISTDAAEVIRTLIVAADVPESSGLRISSSQNPSNGRGHEFLLELSEEPNDDDAVIEEEGAHVFVEPVASQILDDKLLDVEPTQRGGPEFALRERRRGFE